MGGVVPRALAAGGQFQAAQDAVAHFGGSLVGEGQGHHFFRVVHQGEEAQGALGEEFGLAGPGRGLDHDGNGFEGLDAGVGIGLEQGVSGSHGEIRRWGAKRPQAKSRTAAARTQARVARESVATRGGAGGQPIDRQQIDGIGGQGPQAEQGCEAQVGRGCARCPRWRGR